MSRTRFFALAMCILALLGCASTRVETSGTPLQQALCPPDGRAVPTRVYWLPQWRPDQKEPQRREAAARQGMAAYLEGSGCMAGAPIERLDGLTAPPANAELLRLAAAQEPAPQRVLLIVVHELGPRLVIGIPALVQGSTEVVLQVRVLDVPAARTLADARIHWENGGSFVVKGVSTLPEDMRAALHNVLQPAAP